MIKRIYFEAETALQKKQAMMLRSLDPDLDLDSLEAKMLMLNVVDNYFETEDGIDIYGDVIIEYTNFEKIPVEINKIVGNLFIWNNDKLKSLVGCPKNVAGNVYINDNYDLISLEGLPSYIGRYLSIRNNGREFTREEIRNICNARGEIYL